MFTINSQDSIHKAWLYRLLIAIVDNNNLQELHFKGGTCAAMRDILDRFSVDLDFDYVGNLSNLSSIRKELKKIFQELGLEIKDESAKVPQFFLKYPSKDSTSRNTLKIDITFPAPKSNNYEPVKLIDISRVVVCQTVATMFANKLVAVVDRYERNKSLAGRDIYDIHHFFSDGLTYDPEVIKERTGLSPLEYFKKLRLFIAEHITEKIIDQDLNPLLSYERFRILRKTLKIEVQMYLSDEIQRLQD
jgi:predicted nucleotidyltransferase component of viral defense system